MSPEREAAILAVIERTHAAGLPIRPLTIYREVKGNKPRAIQFIKAWLAAHPEAEAPAEAAPDGVQVAAEGPACHLTDGLPDALPPTPLETAQQQLTEAMAQEQALVRERKGVAHRLRGVAARREHLSEALGRRGIPLAEYQRIEAELGRLHYATIEAQAALDALAPQHQAAVTALHATRQTVERLKQEARREARRAALADVVGA